MFSSNTSSAAGDANYIEDVFSTWLYTGNGATQTITNGIDLAGKGGLVWNKNRTGGSSSHTLFDTARTAGKSISSDTTNAQSNNSTVDSFTTTGFTTGALPVRDFVAWTFREQPKFFDVVTYTGTGSATTFAHNLGSAPGCMIVKCTSTGGTNWRVYHRSLTSAAYNLKLNLTSAEGSEPSVWNSTAPTSTVFSVGSDPGVNNLGDTYVAYLFAHDAGGFGLTGTDNVISCGSASATGVTAVSLGYEPQFCMLKQSSGTGGWFMTDTMRGWNMVGDVDVRANVADAETDRTGSGWFPSATGFTFDSAQLNGSGDYIYIAIRRGPMKVPTDGTSVFTPVTYTGNNTDRTISAPFVADLAIIKIRTGATASATWADRLRANNYLSSDNTASENADPSVLQTNPWDVQGGVKIGNSANRTNNFSGTYVDWMFQRAPGFFDVVCYSGTGSATTFSHNLAAVPELMIVKKRSASGTDWNVYHSALGNTQVVFLDLTNATATAPRWNDTTPTASVFSIGSHTQVNESGATFVWYGFATCPGVSKVGSYTGTGTTLQINCGFTGGARFVLIKRTDSTGDWYVWDSARGIVSGNDPYLLLNSTAAEDTSTDYIDTSSAGFEISSTAPAAINANGGTFIFLAIA
jgi:hypothetical protein